eukprot:TRINITY_DN26700_c0_g2_i1.p1 TRINITY_DN26700_c0_g2~~TRINITY_DN26700_c0_g2_i1.p1  ORF type:complete len:284 (-),score=38.85 TRINITY_DN26700_c0_g2_i1:588-1439(-)
MPTAHRTVLMMPMPTQSTEFSSFPTYADSQHPLPVAVRRPKTPPTPVSSSRLVDNWALWASWRLNSDPTDAHEIQHVATVNTVEDFLEQSEKLTVEDLPANVSLYTLKQGTSPVYSDPLNKRGGHIKIRTVSLTAGARVWRIITSALVTGKVPHYGGVTGAAVVRKDKSTTVQLWVAEASQREVVESLRSFIYASVAQSDFFRVKFCPHKFLIRTVKAKKAKKQEATPPESPVLGSTPLYGLNGAPSRAAQGLPGYLFNPVQTLAAYTVDQTCCTLGVTGSQY